MSGDPRAAGEARDRLGQVLDQLGVGGDAADIALLLVSELVTNAVLHARDDAAVEIRANSDVLWVGVDDRDSRRPAVQPVDAGALGGRGLRLVDVLSDDWGVRHVQGDGKTVWFTVSRRTGFD
ncbi:ATP-binding protein [Parafrankia elaeagni]|uniref:ATP-binding protein n=1 Tax=Parafrankia elaeagni TaxID=222534 RepID=UPI0003A89DB9|nr:ATP-binding protein [Parafrankia elaeagni]